MSDLISSLQSALATPPSKDGFTVVELCEKVGLDHNNNHNRDKVRKFIRVEIAAGRLIGKMGHRPSITGNVTAVPVFLPVTKKIK